MKYISHILTAIAVIAVAVFLLRDCEREDKFRDLKQAHEIEKRTLSDSIQRTKNALNQETATRQAIHANYQVLKNDVISKDELINELKSNLTKKTVTETAIITQTHVNEYAKSDSTTYDTVKTKPGQPAEPCAKIMFFHEAPKDSAWIKMNEVVYIDNDSIARDIRVMNDLFIKNEYHKQGLFKPNKLYITAFNKNPFTTTLNEQSFVVDRPKKTKAGKIIQIGSYIIVGATCIYLGTHIK